MEGRRVRSRRKVLRTHETDRLEEDLWILAYDQICPSSPRIGKRSSSVRQSSPPGVSVTAGSPIARSA